MTDDEAPPYRPIVIGPDAAQGRREVGLVAWCALECLVARAEVIDEQVVAHASVREIAAELGVAKNTAHRAIGILRDGAFIYGVEQERSAGGGFGATRYLLDIEDALELAAPTAPAPPVPATRPATRTRTARATAVDQLSLLDPTPPAR